MPCYRVRGQPRLGAFALLVEMSLGHIRGTARRIIGTLGRVAGDRGETLKMYDSLGYLPNLAWPRSFSEKVVRRKLGRHPAVWSEYADKIKVRDHVQQRVGGDCLIDVHLVTDNPDEIRLAALPSRFVVKANHGSGWNLIVDGRVAISEADIQAQCRRWLSMRYGVNTHEEWYSSIHPAIVVEEYLADAVHGLPLDYKFWVFHGVVEFVQVDFGRFSHHTRTIYDRRWNRQPWNVRFPPGPDLARPKTLDRMIEIAEDLAVDPEFVRVDLYSPNDDTVRFGELTLSPGAGWIPFSPGKSADFWVGTFW
jgi:hypothetical protein